MLKDKTAFIRATILYKQGSKEYACRREETEQHNLFIARHNELSQLEEERMNNLLTQHIFLTQERGKKIDQLIAKHSELHQQEHEKRNQRLNQYNESLREDPQNWDQHERLFNAYTCQLVPKLKSYHG